MGGARAIGLLVTLGLVIAGCGSTPDDTTDAADEAETRIRRSEPSLVTEAAVDPAGTVWILGQRDGNLVLSAHPLGEAGATSTDLGPFPPGPDHRRGSASRTGTSWPSSRWATMNR